MKYRMLLGTKVVDQMFELDRSRFEQYLQERGNVVCHTTFSWPAGDPIKDFLVSTVCLPLGHEDGCFETMIFDKNNAITGDLDQTLTRTKTYEEAMREHEEAVRHVMHLNATIRVLKNEYPSQAWYARNFVEPTERHESIVPELEKL